MTDLTDMEKQERTKVLMEFATLSEASVVEGLLKANDIPCFLGNTYSMYLLGLFADVSVVQLVVFEKDVERANALIEQTELDFGSLDDDKFAEEDIPEEFRDDGKEDDE